MNIAFIGKVKQLQQKRLYIFLHILYAGIEVLHSGRKSFFQQKELTVWPKFFSFKVNE